MRWIKRIVIFLIAAVAILSLTYFFLWWAVDLRTYRITSGSMAPALEEGDIIIVFPATGEIGAGDIIVFENSLFEQMFNLPRATHRVVQGVTHGSGRTFYITKGDANIGPDIVVTYEEDVVGRVEWIIPTATIYRFVSYGVYLFAALFVIIAALYILSARDCEDSVAMRRHLEECRLPLV